MSGGDNPLAARVRFLVGSYRLDLWASGVPVPGSEVTLARVVYEVGDVRLGDVGGVPVAYVAVERVGQFCSDGWNLPRVGQGWEPVGTVVLPVRGDVDGVDAANAMAARAVRRVLREHPGATLPGRVREFLDSVEGEWLDPSEAELVAGRARSAADTLAGILSSSVPEGWRGWMRGSEDGFAVEITQGRPPGDAWVPLSVPEGVTPREAARAMLERFGIDVEPVAAPEAETSNQPETRKP